jgi:SulP family sulfate permease
MSSRQLPVATAMRTLHAFESFMDARQHRLGATLSAGVTVGILTILTQASFATLLFPGPLAAHVGVGFRMALSGAVIIGVILTLAGSFPGTVGRPHELPVVILALLSARIAHELPAKDPLADPFSTVVVMIALTTLLFGILSMVLGQCGAGNLFRFLPYPVLGGFVAGSGMLLAKGGFTVMIGSAGTPWDRPLPLASPSLWVPGVLFGLAMFLAARLCRSWLTIPAFLVIGLLTFQLLLGLSGMGLEQARLAGLLPPDALLASSRAIPTSPLAISWGMLSQLIPDMVSVAFISSLGTLLNASAIEVTIRQELNLNRDLKAVGLANLLSACVGAPAGFHSLSATTLPQHMGVRGHAPALIAVGLCLMALIIGPGLVDRIPYAVSGGLLLFLGLSLLGNWLIDQRVFLTGLEFFVLVAILLVMVTAGWMAAILFGLILALILFTFDYSRISAVRSVLTGRTRHSNVDRSVAKTGVLARYGDSILILCLQGHLFFGTAHSLLRTIRQQLESDRSVTPHWILIDMRVCSGLDASAINTFCRIRQLCDSFSVELIFTAPNRQILEALQKARILEVAREGQEWFSDLDHGLEFCENELLAFHADELPPERHDLDGLLAVSSPSERTARERLLHYLEPREWRAGSVIIHQGDPPSSLHFILSGSVVVERRNGSEETPLRLRTMDPGTCVGEISFYLHTPTTASVIASTEVRTLSLDLEGLARMEANDAESAILLHRTVARRLGERLVLTNQLAFDLLA